MYVPGAKRRSWVTRTTVTLALVCVLALGALWATQAAAPANAATSIGPSSTTTATAPSIVAAHHAVHTRATLHGHTASPTSGSESDCYLHCTPQEVGTIAIGALLLTIVAVSTVWAPRKPRRTSRLLRQVRERVDATRASAVPLSLAGLSVFRT